MGKQKAMGGKGKGKGRAKRLGAKGKGVEKGESAGKTNTVVDITKPNSNWDALKAQIAGDGKAKERREEAERRRSRREGKIRDGKFAPQARRENSQETRIVALDCEMVGVGDGGQKSALARVVVVNYYGNVLVDTFCTPKGRVTDYRTRVSGVRPQDLRGAPQFEQVQQRVATLLKGKVVVGHALKNDFKALHVGHPKQDIRDTARYAPLRKLELPGNGAASVSPPAVHARFKSRALKELAAEHLGLEIQHGEHSPVEDARAALYLYHKHKVEWERDLLQVSRNSKEKRKRKGAAGQDTVLGEKFKESAGVQISERKLKHLERKEERVAAAEKKETEESNGYGLDLFVSE
ncbi:exonuclease [Chloropicon primus]|uniref:RNA exonuclease 4 n=2 Tax=Chloropicon primus TaxID=1764295 RepID=A0A5B8MN22_9CHLO|nr:exonuclease [Chloropicon primus]UPR00656.1 exonuclease [Chloropicon primus]|eukprot:QDZ21444.1 exonuclease [Chloropicon primus]